MISDRISNDILPQMKILNIFIPILMHFFACLLLKSLFRLKLEHCKPLKVAFHPTKCVIINDLK